MGRERMEKSGREIKRFDITDKTDKIINPLITEMEMEAFNTFFKVGDFEDNMKDVVYNMIANHTDDGTSSMGNVVVMGSNKSGKTKLAIELIKLINKKLGIKGRRLAKISAVKLNEKGIEETFKKLRRCDLIIEGAQLLEEKTIDEILEATKGDTDNMLIALEGDTDKMNELLTEYPKMTEVFNYKIIIREYNIHEWVNYGREYAGRKGYKMDEIGQLAFYKAIDDFYGTTKHITKNDIENMIDKAIKRSKTFRGKLRHAFVKKENDTGLQILVEKDFDI